MAAIELDGYLTFESRLASFSKNAKKRGSTASVRGKALTWPHKQIAPTSLAKAGFYFDPTPASPDNVTCFLCGKGLDGWEEGDDPLLEHLKHASHCGWAVVAAIEAEIDDYAKTDPSSADMIEARKATFADMWPHESKKGWKCKTKQLVESGWKYTPTNESDDMATCTYCQLALDGWEPGDKPYDEHFNRSPGCAFFALAKQFEGARKKTSRAKASRGSKASRLSVQSTTTVASESLSTGDTTAVGEDSTLTTASSTSQGGKKPRAKRAATVKGSRTKAKKNESIAIEPADDSKDDTALKPKPTKATRGKKRGSEAMEESGVSLSEAPAPKKRATRVRSSTVTNATTVIPDESDLMDPPAPARKPGARKKNQGSIAAESRQASAYSTVSSASMASLRGPALVNFPDDEEIERQLEADLEDEWNGDNEGDINAVDSYVEHQPPPASQPSADYAMFDPAAADPDDAAVEEELLALQAEMQVDEPPKPQPKTKSRSATVSKPAKQVRSKKAKATTPPKEQEAEIPEPPSIAAAEEVPPIGATKSDDVDKVEPIPAEPVKRGRGRPSKHSLASQKSVDDQKPPAQPPKRGRGRPSKASLASRASNDAVDLVEPAVSSQSSEQPVKRGRGRPPKRASEPDEAPPAEDVMNIDAEEGGDAPAESDEVATAHADDKPAEGLRESLTVVEQRDAAPVDELASLHLAEPPSTPTKVISPAPSAKQPALSPSQSPQSSDAENRPPSSKPANSTTTKRVVLAPVSITPMRGSPQKRNVLAGLQSSTPWTAVNLEAVLGTPEPGLDKENAVGRLLKKGKDLTSPEKSMTVEEWIYFNAGEAEKKLKHECETMVSKFEREGTRAMNVLEGLAAE
ncbi:hypothetical protein HIM_02580 [Hirsutella minnesotensis 3608]|nr:hypothetical protein HIM_02580 [Hirsutella minnesotensis 3608]